MGILMGILRYTDWNSQVQWWEFSDKVMGILRYTDGKPDTVTGILNTVKSNCKEEISEFFYALT